MSKHAAMNRIYRLVWNAALGAFVPVSELARSRGKRSGRSFGAVVGTALTFVTASGWAAEPAANALPTGGQVVQGAASLNQAGARLDVRQTTDRAIIDWRTFDVGRDASVNFLQPSSASVTLNRVLSDSPSSIFGRLSANGQVFLANPQGVLFGAGARVDVGGLVATSMQIDPADFLAGRYRFAAGLGSVVNQGTLTAANGGYLALLAPEVRNEGVLSARLGTVALAGGQAATLQLSPGGALSVQVDPAAVNVLAENRHLIEAEGGQVILAASAAERLVSGAIPGANGATRLVAENGTVRLVNVEGTVRAKSIAVDGGAVGVTRVAGALDATGDGGAIVVTGDKVLVDAGASLDASGANGGRVLVGGDRQGQNPEVRNARRVYVAEGATVRADGGAGTGATGDGGRVILYSREGTQVHGDVRARGGAAGGRGGFVETSGAWLDVTSVPDVTAAAGRGGEWLIDPSNITITADGYDDGISFGLNWESVYEDAILSTQAIQAALNAGTSVTVATGEWGSQGGDIVVASAITKSAGGNATLTLNAHRDIVLDAPITSTSGALSLVFDADVDADQAGAIVQSANLRTLGGSIQFRDGLVVGGTSAISIDTAGGAGGSVLFQGQVLIGNTNGLSIATGGGAVTFQSMIDSGNGYAYVSTPRDWTSARSAAASGTGAAVGDRYLATVTSPLEMSRVAAIAGYQQAWLGGNDAGVEGTWRWVTGPEGLENGGAGRIFLLGNRGWLGPLTGYNGYAGAYVNWNSGEPNDYNGGEDALQMGFGAAAQWNDLPITGVQLGYVVETNLGPSPLTIDAGAGTVTFNGNVGANKAIGRLNINGTGAVALNANTINVQGNVYTTVGGNIDVGAGYSPTIYADDGSITLNRNVVKNAGGDASLTLRADGDVALTSGARILSNVGRLNVTLNSNRDGLGDGGIVLGTTSQIVSNGGNVVLGGGSAPESTGALGSWTSAERGIYLYNARISAGAGNVTLNGTGGTHDARPDQLGIGIDLVLSTIETTTGGISLLGVGSGGGYATSYGISVFNASTVRSTAGGSVTLAGSAVGSSTAEAGVSIDGSTVGLLSGGTLSITGTGSSTGTGASNHGIVLTNSASVLGTGTGTISLTGTAGAGSTGIVTAGGSNLVGNASGYGGAITFTADSIALANLAVRGSGSATVRPLTVGTTIGLGDGAAGTLNLTSAELASFQDGFGLLTFGRTDGTGDVDVRDYVYTDAVKFVSGAGDGDVTINGRVQNSGGGVTVEAGDTIVVAAAGGVTTQGGAIVLDSDRDSSGAGGISLATGAALASNGGSVTLRGGTAALGAVADPTSAAASYVTALNATGARGAGSAGIELTDATIAAGGGNVELRGVGADGYDGVRLGAGSSVGTTGSGTVTIHGLGGSTGADADGVAVLASGVTVQNGTLTLQGLGRGGSDSQGIELSSTSGGGTLTGTGGDLVLRGASTANGSNDQGVVAYGGATIRTAGRIDVAGRASGTVGGTGVHFLTDALLDGTGGDVTITGYGSTTGTNWNNEGVKIDHAVVQVSSTGATNLRVYGYGGTGSSYNIGVNVRVSGVLRTSASAGGSLTVVGTGGAGSVTGNWGVLAEDGIYESLGAAPILITGYGGTGTDNVGIKSTGGANNRIGAATMTGDITLRADAVDLDSDAIVLQSAGAFTLEPVTAGTSMRVGSSGAGALTFGTAAIGRLADGFRQLTFGRADGTGLVTVGSSAFTDPVRFASGGAGSAGLVLAGTVDAGANTLWLASGGGVTQSAPLTAGQLLLTGSGAVTLTNAGNVFATLAGSLGGALTLVDAGSMTVGSITANGATWNGLTNTATTLLRTGGDLTLQRAVATAASGTGLQLVVGGRFLNPYGAGALSAGPGRWLVWSTDPAANVVGLGYDFKQYGATYGTTAPAQAGGNGFLYAVTPTVTPSLTGTVSRTYDRSTTATLAGSNLTATGAIDGDTVVLTAGSAAYETKDVGTGKQVDASSISIASATNGAATVYGYTLGATTASATIGTITAKLLTPSLTGTVTKVYDGTDVATLSAGNYALSGVVDGDSVSLGSSATARYASADVGARTVGIGGLTLGGAAAGNYALVADTASAAIGSITSRPLTVAVVDASRLYGDANPAFTVTYANFAPGQDATVLGGALAFQSAAVTANVGSHAITAGGLTSSNYAIAYVPGMLTITPAALTVTAVDASKVYGAADPALLYTIGGDGLRNGDLLTGALSAPVGSAATAGTHAIVQGTLAASPNYTLAYVPGTLTVSRAPLTITALDRSKVYGTADPSLGYALGGGGLQYGDALTGALSAPTGAVAIAGTHAILQGTLTAGANYAVTFVPGTLTVARSPLTITARDQSKVYGEVDPALTYVLGGAGLQYADAMTGALAAPVGAAATFGTHAITQGTLSPGSNYEVTFVAGRLDVARSLLLISALDQSKVYGAADPRLTYTVGAAGLHYGDTLSGALAAPSGAAATAGTHAITRGTLDAGENYAVAFVPATLTVARAPLTVTALDRSKVYGAADPSLAYAVGGAGLQYGDVLTGALVAPTGAAATAGTHAIGQGTLTANANYALTYVPGTLTVSRAPLTITALDVSKVYGAADPSLAYAVGGAGLQYGDVLTGALVAPTGAAATAGTHAIAQGTLAANANYALTYVPGTLTVSRAPLTVTALDRSKVYGATDPSLAYAVGGAGLQYGDVLTGALVAPTGAAATAGTHAIGQGTLTANANYALTYVPGTLTVSRAPLVVRAADRSKTYGDADPSLSYAIEGPGLAYGDVLTGALLAPTGAAATAGTHAIAQGSLAATTNYALTFLPGTLTVGRAPLVITADDLTRAAYAENPTLTAHGSGWRYDDGFGVVTGLMLTTTADRASLPGTYAITAGGASAANYAITYAPGALVVKPAPAAERPQGGEVVTQASRVVTEPAVQQATAAAAADLSVVHGTIRDGGVAVPAGASNAGAAGAPGAGAAGTQMSPGFVAVEPLPALALAGGARVDFTLPAGTFRHGDPAARLVVSVECADGSPLPASMSYDPQTGELTGTLPDGVEDLAVVFVARDGQGEEARTTLTLHAGR
jgi:filamentous hemagglutinin family protein